MTKQEIFLILDNIRSAENVGSIFRTADAVEASKIYLCGYTPVPPNDKISKTALGAEKYVPWEKRGQTWRLIKELKKSSIEIIALEQSKKSLDYKDFNPRFPLALIVGNEINGLSKKILANSDKVVEIPMLGKKESLNVSVALGIAVFKINERRK